ncbi:MULTISPECIES: hypothetical protein [Nocardiopsis]|uniref:hypothetical protein n=1 Tax=Nocardiopsis TaxID=2013 RepID=UPI000345D07E|nr:MULTISPECIES: hypothetical protein [Nocardiopsis]PWV45727.1 hypothetical protein BDW27_11661 [Nocardiopsis sp. L17-MgMaSL7]
MPYLFEEDVPKRDILFDYALPEGWKQYDLSGDSLAEMRAKVLEAYGNRPEEAEALNELIADMSRVTDEATGSGLISAAGTFEEYDDGFFMATVCVFAFPAGKGPHAIDPLRLVDYVYQDSATAREGTWLNKTVVDLTESGLGQCGRIYGVTDYDTDEAILRTVAMHTAMEYPGLDKRILVSCTSPNSREVDEVLDLFDAITGSARFWERDVPPAEDT